MALYFKGESVDHLDFMNILVRILKGDEVSLTGQSASDAGVAWELVNQYDITTTAGYKWDIVNRSDVYTFRINDYNGEPNCHFSLFAGQPSSLDRAYLMVKSSFYNVGFFHISQSNYFSSALHKAPMRYWVNMDERRVIITLNIAGVYTTAYYGLLVPTATPVEYPRPIVMAANFNNSTNTIRNSYAFWHRITTRNTSVLLDTSGTYMNCSYIYTPVNVSLINGGKFLTDLTVRAGVGSGRYWVQGFMEGLKRIDNTDLNPENEVIDQNGVKYIYFSGGMSLGYDSGIAMEFNP